MPCVRHSTESGPVQVWLPGQGRGGGRMTVSTGDLPRSSKRPPLTDAEMGAMWSAGDPMAVIAQRGRGRNGLRREQVRAIVHRECGLAAMGEGR